MNPIRYELAAGIVTLNLDWPDEPVNKIDAAFLPALEATVVRLEAEREAFRGVILTSAKKTFFAGADLKAMLAITPADAAAVFSQCEAIKVLLRRLEKLGRPVVATIAGAALGGGWEIALACHHRVCLSDPKIQLGLPEVSLGLMPGAGGVVRTVRRLGLEASLPLLAEGRLMAPAAAAELGLVELATDAADLLERAHAWIAAHPAPIPPWDAKGYKIPGGGLDNPRLAARISVAPAMLVAKTQGVYPAPKAILCAAVEGLAVDFDTACRIESRYFTQLATGAVAKNMIATLFFGINELKAGASRPQAPASPLPAKVGVVGAGMMGSGIAWANASRGFACVLMDVGLDVAEKGKASCGRLADRHVERGRMTPEQRDQLLARIQPTAAASDLEGCDLIIEAVFENSGLKTQLMRETEPWLAANGVFASNTSTLPISDLARASRQPANVVGLHFFSPVDKMQLVEIVAGRETSPDTVARAYDYVLALGKTPIVVNDARGFYTSRVIGKLLSEAVGMVEEGIPPALIERASLMAGFPVGVLALQDELNLKLALHVIDETRLAEGLAETGAERVLRALVAQGRAGRAAGAGFYDYPADGPKHLWHGLAALAQAASPLPADAPPADAEALVREVGDRLLYVQAIDSVRCLEEGVIDHARDANVGAVLGIGFPPWTGGTLQFINSTGLDAFIERTEQLAARYGERFSPPPLLRQMAARQQVF